VRGVSATIDAAKLLRPGLLDGVHVVVAGAPPLAEGGDTSASARRERPADAVASTSAELGARVSGWGPGDAVAADVDQLVVDAAGLFAAAGESGPGRGGARTALNACLDGAWEATRAVASAAFIDAGRAGRVVYLAPASSADGSQGAAHADAARAGLENLARTLSIEWARYGVTLVTIAPGERTSLGEVAAVAAFLGSAAGAYYSGCLFDLRGLAAVPAGGRS
jgi:NAD(P)-dependent dehydrogenase (short-subunit alcohol dehydrogenase family)